jgi:hypothetical protein
MRIAGGIVVRACLRMSRSAPDDVWSIAAMRSNEAATGADAVVIVTEWHSSARPKRLKQLMAAPVMVDLTSTAATRSRARIHHCGRRLISANAR